MRKLILLFLILGCSSNPKPVWTGDRWQRPAGYEVYASDRELVEGKSFVHCVK